MEQPRHILIVDDDDSPRAVIRVTLELEGHTVAELASGELALEVARSSRPDLVILDLLMPGVDGLAVLRDLRADASLAMIAVVVLTALADEDSEQRARALGARAYIAKPVDVDDLVRAISRILASET